MSKHTCSAEQNFLFWSLLLVWWQITNSTVARGFNQAQNEVDNTKDDTSDRVKEATCQKKEQKNCDLVKVDFCGSLSQVEFEPVFFA